MKHYHCPVNGWTCPYFVEQTYIGDNIENYVCTCPGNPYEECDDFYAVWGDDISPDDYTDY